MGIIVGIFLAFLGFMFGGPVGAIIGLLIGILAASKS